MIEFVGNEIPVEELKAVVTRTLRDCIADAADNAELPITTGDDVYFRLNERTVVPTEHGVLLERFLTAQGEVLIGDSDTLQRLVLAVKERFPTVTVRGSVHMEDPADLWYQIIDDEQGVRVVPCEAENV